MREKLSGLPRRWLHVSALALVVLGVVGGAAQSPAPAFADPIVTNLVSNGGFESPIVASDDFDTWFASTTPTIVTGWRIESGSIDHIGGYWDPKAGDQSIDLDGHGPGAISQTLATVEGQSYILSFAYSTNFDRETTSCTSVSAGMDVKWGNDPPIHVDHAPATKPQMDWAVSEETVHATSVSTKLEFVSTDNAGCPWGIALDAVSVTPVPVPLAPAPTLFGAVPNGPAGPGGVAGLLEDDVTTFAEYEVTFYTSPTCDGDPTQLGDAAQIDTGDNLDGIAGFAIDQPTLPEGLFVRAKASRVGGPLSGFSNCVPVEANNTSWPSALPLDPSGAAKNGFLRTQGEARWFKLPIQPNGRVDVSLKGLPADYDLVVFSDIKAAYDALTTSASGTPDLSLNDLAKQDAGTPADAFNTSQYNPSAWDPTNWDPTLNSAGFSASQWSPSQWSPSQWSASQWSPSQWSPSQWSASQWSPSQWSASQWSPSQWSASQWSPSQWSSFSPSDPQLFSSAQTTSLLAVSASTGTGDENVSINTWNNTGDVYIRVQGKNGSFDQANPFTVSAKGTGTSCTGVTDQPSTPTAPTGPLGDGYGTLILTDRSRMTFNSTLDGQLTTFKNKVNGAEVDVSLDPAVGGLNAQADLHKSCPYAKNLVAYAVKRIVDAYRAENPIKYVVVIGSDGVIPFFRYPDPSLLANETLYSPPVLDSSASQASLRLGYILNQDAYGSKDQVSQLGTDFPVPDLPVGRLVETPTEIGGLLDAFNGLPNGVVATPTTSLVTGYDFLEDAAVDVNANLKAGIGPSGIATTLITKQTVAPSVVTVNGSPDSDHSWTGADLRKALFASGRHDLIFLAGHFSANDALAADYATSVLSTELAASTTSFVNAIVFSAGCHSGYNIVNGDAIPSVTESLDWAQAFAQKKATFIGGTGYQYGDTDFLAYSERIYAEFSRQLRVEPARDVRGPVSVGNALVRSKRMYMKSTPKLSALDAKALLEATLFGLPMLSVDLPGERVLDPDGVTTIAGTQLTGNELGLRTADTSVNLQNVLDPKNLQLKNGPLATYLTGPGGVTVIPTQPILPLVSANVTAPDSGYILRGAGFLGGAYADTSGVTPLTAAPATELRGIHAPFFTDVFFPVQPWSFNSFDAIGGSGSTRLSVTPVQHISDPADLLKSTRRQFSNMNFRLFYSNNLSQAALAAPPTITGVDTSFDSGSLKFKARVVGDVAAGIQAVWVTYTTTQSGLWQTLDLVRDPADESLWTGSIVIADPATVAFMVQAVNGVGRVALDTNVGAYYRPGSIPGAPLATGSPQPAQATLTLDPLPTPSVRYGESFDARINLTCAGGAAGKLVLIRLGASGQPAITDADGKATVHLRAGVSPGDYPVTATFAGDGSCSAADASGSVKVVAMGTTLTLTGTAAGAGFAAFATDPLWLTATLRDNGTPAAALTPRTVFLILTGTGPSNTGVKTNVQGKTDPLGRVQIGSTNLAALPVGNYKVDAYFNGVPSLNILPDDVDYAPSDAHTTLALNWPSIVFASARTGNGDIYTADIRGGAAVKLTSGNAVDAEPAWSPDHKKIAFTSTRDGNVEIYVMDADGSHVIRLTTQSAIDSSPAWSPDGTKIAFSSNRSSGNWDIFVMNAAGGGNVTRLTTNSAADTVPAWSSNGAKIAFSSSRTGGGDIYSMTATGASQVRLTTSAAIDTEPDWFGSTVAFSTNRDGILNFEIYTMTDTGGSQTRRTTESRPDTSPSWSPDGTKIAFASNRPGGVNFDVYTMNPNGTGQASLAANSAIDLFPDW